LQPSTPGVCDQDVQTLSDDSVNQLGQRMRPFWLTQIGCYLVGTAAGLPNLHNDSFGFLFAAAVVN